MTFISNCLVILMLTAQHRFFLLMIYIFWLKCVILTRSVQ